MIATLIHALLALLPVGWRRVFHAWRFRAIRETFYRETRLDIDREGLRPRETLIERIETLMRRDERRGGLVWPAYQELLTRLRAGEGYAQALKPLVPTDEYALLDISTSSTRTDAVARGFELAGMVAYAKRVLSGSVSAELAYPALLLTMAFGISLLFGGMVFTDLPDLQPVSHWSPLGQMLYALNTFNYQNWGGVLLAVAGLIAAYFVALRYWTGPVRNRIDAWPFLFRNRRDLAAAMLIVSLASLFESGLTLRAALNRLAEQANPWMSWHLAEMNRRLDTQPDEPLLALDTGLFAVEIVDRIADAARRANFEEAIRSLGHESLGDVVEQIRSNARINHYVMLGLAALLIGVIGLGSYVTVVEVGFSAYSTVH